MFRPMENPALKLVEGLGGRAATAAKFRVSSEAIRLWLKRGIPADRALEVEDATRGTAFEIRSGEVLAFNRAQRVAA